MKLVYFAWVRERIGKAEEEVDAARRRRRPSPICSRWLKARGEDYEHALAACRRRSAPRIDQEHVEHARADRRRARDRALPADDRRLSRDGRLGPDRPHPARGFRHRRRDRAPDARAAPTSARSSPSPASAATRTGTLAALELEHYPGMAEAEIGRIADEAAAALAACTASPSSTATARSARARTSCWWSPPRRTARRRSRRRAS